jgi:hypothetical protein
MIKIKEKSVQVLRQIETHTVQNQWGDSFALLGHNNTHTIINMVTSLCRMPDSAAARPK